MCTIGPSVRTDMTTKLTTDFTINKMLGFNMLLHVLLGLARMLTIYAPKLIATHFYYFLIDCNSNAFITMFH